MLMILCLFTGVKTAILTSFPMAWQSRKHGDGANVQPYLSFAYFSWYNIYLLLVALLVCSSDAGMKRSLWIILTWCHPRHVKVREGSCGLPFHRPSHLPLSAFISLHNPSFDPLYLLSLLSFFFSFFLSFFLSVFLHFSLCELAGLYKMIRWWAVQDARFMAHEHTGVATEEAGMAPLVSPSTNFPLPWVGVIESFCSSFHFVYPSHMYISLSCHLIQLLPLLTLQRNSQPHPNQRWRMDHFSASHMPSPTQALPKPQL